MAHAFAETQTESRLGRRYSMGSISNFRAQHAGLAVVTIFVMVMVAVPRLMSIAHAQAAEPQPREFPSHTGSLPGHSRVEQGKRSGQERPSPLGNEHGIVVPPGPPSPSHSKHCVNKACWELDDSECLKIDYCQRL
jgi:hypothetical protein